MSDLGRAATARRLYLHVLSGGSLTPDDVSRMVQAIEELEAEVATARNDALEEAAKVGAEAATDWANDNSEKAARMGIWNTVHAAIRALKSTN